MTPEDRELLFSLRRQQREIQQSLEKLNAQLTALEARAVEPILPPPLELPPIPEHLEPPPLPIELLHEIPPPPPPLVTAETSPPRTSASATTTRDTETFI